MTWMKRIFKGLKYCERLHNVFVYDHVIIPTIIRSKMCVHVFRPVENLSVICDNNFAVCQQVQMRVHGNVSLHMQQFAHASSTLLSCTCCALWVNLQQYLNAHNFGHE